MSGDVALPAKHPPPQPPPLPLRAHRSLLVRPARRARRGVRLARRVLRARRAHLARLALRGRVNARTRGTLRRGACGSHRRVSPPTGVNAGSTNSMVDKLRASKSGGASGKVRERKAEKEERSAAEEMLSLGNDDDEGGAVEVGSRMHAFVRVHACACPRVCTPARLQVPVCNSARSVLSFNICLACRVFQYVIAASPHVWPSGLWSVPCALVCGLCCLVALLNYAVMPVPQVSTVRPQHTTHLP